MPSQLPFLPCSELQYYRRLLVQTTEVTRIGTIMKKMAEHAGLKGKKTNHSARKTMVTNLTKSNVPDTQVMQLSGHRNIQSLNAYKKASLQQQKEMSHILSGCTNKPPFQPACVAEQPIKEAENGQSLFRGANLSGCTINIGFPFTSCSSSHAQNNHVYVPKSTKTPCVIYSDSDED